MKSLSGNFLLVLTCLIINACTASKDEEVSLNTCKISQINSSLAYTAGNSSASNITFNYNDKGQYIGGTSSLETKDDTGTVTWSTNLSVNAVK